MPPALKPKRLTRSQRQTVADNERLVWSIVHRHYRAQTDHPTLSTEDLGAAGMTGLIRAAQKFDPRRGASFSTYATPWIRQAISRYVEQAARLVRLPSYKIHELRHAERDALARGEPCTVSDWQQFRPVTVSLQGDRVGDDRIDVVDETAEAVIDGVLRRERIESVHGALRRIDQRRASVVAVRFGIYSGEPRTLETTARIMGLSRARVGQLCREGMDDLREVLARSEEAA